MTNPNDAGSEYWNGTGGDKWTTNQERLDILFQEVSERLINLSGLVPGQSVLDVGCGSGVLALEAAARIGQSGQVTGVDISESLLKLAQHRADQTGAANISFVHADAQTHLFPAGAYDQLISRFGVMFFAHPVQAFSNIRSGLKSGARVTMSAWASVAKNPWFAVPRDAAIARVGKPAPADPRAPGPIAFADIEYVNEILEQAGFKEVSIVEESIVLVIEGDAGDAGRFSCDLGPVLRIVQEKSGSEHDIEQIADAVSGEFQVYELDGTTRVPASVNFVTCVNPG